MDSGFFFYSNEHRPIHVHVRKGGGEAVFEVENQILLRESVGLKTSELRDAEALAAEHRQLIITMCMSTLIDKPTKAVHRNGRIHVSMASGLDFSFPIEGNPRLEGKPDNALSNIEISPFGLHWPDLDEDLSIRGILAGDYGQRDRKGQLT